MFWSGIPEWEDRYFFFELSGQFNVSEVHEIFFGDVRVKVLFVSIEGI